MAASETISKIRLFYSYSHKDEKLREKLEAHLSPLKRDGLIEEWHDRKISAGNEWGEEINENLENADIILLLISSDFIASNYCHEKEMRRALERHRSKEARVIPVLLRSCDWKLEPYGELQALPSDIKPITSWTNQDDAWTNVAKGIRKAIEEIRAERDRKISLLERIKPDSFPLNKTIITLEDYRKGAEILLDQIESRDSFDPEMIIAVNQGGMVVAAVINKSWRKPVGVAYTASEKGKRVVKTISLPGEIEGSLDSSNIGIKLNPAKPKKILVVDPKLKSGSSAERIQELLYQAYGRDIDIRFAIILGYGGWRASEWEVVYHSAYEWPVRFKPKNLEVYVAYYTDQVVPPDIIKEEVRPGGRNQR